MLMENYLISEAIGDVAGSAYEGRTHRTKDYNKVKMFSSRAHFTDDTVLTFACAEAFIDNLDMSMNLWKCANEHRHAGFSSTFKKWFASHKPLPYRSLGNGSALPVGAITSLLGAPFFLAIIFSRKGEHD